MESHLGNMENADHECRELFGLALEGKVCCPIFVIYVLRNFTYLCTVAFRMKFFSM
jgi:hypothetical protein